MSILGDAKDIAEVIKAMGNIDLHRKIVDLQSEIIDLIQEKNDLERKAMQLAEEIEQSKSMSYKTPFWFKAGDEVAHCPRCWEVERKAVHLIGPKPGSTLGPRYDCAQCKAQFYHPRGGFTEQSPPMLIR